MILLTGAAGFIGSCLHSLLMKRFPHQQIVIADDFHRPEKVRNFSGKPVRAQVQRGALKEWLTLHGREITFVLHIGARTDTAEKQKAIFDALNLDYSKMIWRWCTHNRVPLIYASSAATYGNGENGFSDDPALLPRLKPLNPYGESKHEFDLWAMQQPEQPPYWAGLKFFNVYGPNEYHKGRMASVVFHAYRQISESGRMRLFRSHRPDYGDGEQRRDFIYVKDLAEVIFFLMEKKPATGIFNLGSGTARTFNDLAGAIFSALGKEVQLDYVDTPADIRDTYQYFTEADMSQIRSLGYDKPFPPMEDHVKEYVQNFLLRHPDGLIL